MEQFFVINSYKYFIHLINKIANKITFTYLYKQEEIKKGSISEFLEAPSPADLFSH